MISSVGVGFTRPQSNVLCSVVDGLGLRLGRSSSRCLMRLPAFYDLVFVLSLLLPAPACVRPIGKSLWWGRAQGSLSGLS